MTREEAIKELKIFSGTTRIRLSANFWEALNTVIKALEQETCEDAVSRQAVLDNAYAYGNGLEPEGYCVNVEDIQSLPPVTPTQRWIPVGERLPEENVKVLTQDNEGNIQVDWLLHLELRWFYSHHHIVAWQPLPKPYEGETHEKNN